jgi:hypothetical protein
MKPTLEDEVAREDIRTHVTRWKGQAFHNHKDNESC